MRVATASLLFVGMAISCGSPPTVISPTWPAKPSAASSAPALTPPSSNDPLANVRVVVRDWKPSTETVVVSLATALETTFVAVPLNGDAVVPLVVVQHPVGGTGGPDWSVSPDGRAMVVAVAAGLTTHRLALADFATGSARWLTTTPQMLVTPTWSHDGRSIYFGSWSLAGGDVGLSRVAIGGSPLPSVRGPAPRGAYSSVWRETGEGLIIGADEFNGPTPWVRDPATGRERSFGVHNSSVTSWRPSRPRALVAVRTNIAPGTGYLAVWDDLDGNVTTILSRIVGGADFEPGGSRVVAAASFVADSGPSQLAILSGDGRSLSVLGGTEDGRAPMWLRTGIVYRTLSGNLPNELRVVSPSGGASRTLFTSAAVMNARPISPP